MNTENESVLQRRLENRTAIVGVIGLGYIGLPLAVTVAKRGLTTIGFDVDRKKMEQLDQGISYIEAVDAATLKHVSGNNRLSWTTDFRRLSTCDVIVICVPTPLTRHREPDLRFVTQTAKEIAGHLSAGTLVVLESTTFPGTTAEVLTPILESGGMVQGEDFFVAFSPEREDPGNVAFRTANIPKIVAGDGERASSLVKTFYELVVDEVISVSSTKTAEAIKITENIFRAVNIALVNELKIVFDKMDIDVWEVIDGAASKPFGFMPFYPGPGLGGHCIPIDPFYLTWKAREYGLSTRFIELAGEININMPLYVIRRLREVLDETSGKGLKGAKVLVVGISYKKNVSDMRGSPAAELLAHLVAQGAVAEFHDPLVPAIPKMRDHPGLIGMTSVSADSIAGGGYDAVLIATDHDAVDYDKLTKLGVPIVDTRNAIARRNLPMDRVRKA